MILGDRREMRMVAAPRSRLAALLSAWPRRGVGPGDVEGRRSGRRGGLGLPAEELLVAEPE
jgi:hypothetical protein